MIFQSYQLFILIILCFVTLKLNDYLIGNRNFKLLLISLFNVLVLLCFVKEHTIIVLSIISLLVYFLGQLILRNYSHLVYYSSTLFITSLFVIRNYDFVSTYIQSGFLSILYEPIFSVQKLGLSYILFRHLLWLWHCKKRAILSSNFLCYINYIIFFPTILAGPIDSYNNFQYWFYQKRNSFATKLAYAGVTRLLLGAFKTLILVPLLIDKATNYELLLHVHSPAFSIFLSSVYYSFYIYFDFSGYSDLAIGTSYLLGVKTPENFDNPYLSTNLSEFWKSWHITFSKILSDLFFKPFVRFLNKLLNLSSSKMYVSILGYLFTFIICGLWHGSTLNFLLWGLWHGIGLALLKVWQSSTSNFNQMKATSVFQMLAIAINFSFVSIGWIFFNYKIEQLQIIQNLLLN